MAFAFFIDRVRNCYPLADTELGILASFGSGISSHVPRTELITQGRPSANFGVLLDGMAYRYKLTSDGRRQVVGLICPGDILGLEDILRGTADHTVASLTLCRIAWVPHKRLRIIFHDYPPLSLALWKLFLIDTCIYREWLTNNGCRPALERVAHLICELSFRFCQVGLVVDNTFPWPLTQAVVADALGLTSVHVNRTMHKLRDLELVGLGARSMRIHDWDGLVELAQFDPSYLVCGDTEGR